ncbi:MlaD family protein [Pseudoroseomonas ludipueritiae]|uniref:MCE family protein n=1 Tax=Pseudoroseomonas ludipueritiae TaxID=198093 RepID=A0ABR7RE76_9PROT|nr:MlaD family protein [Pseudoroseomonas ludipueritiae]MBC9180175.1 MCE family protein [Pseudoroseomonas ludipueritiae]MCG7359870.1 MlaD family protein [Roseomonas sp. ACRSG]
MPTSRRLYVRVGALLLAGLALGLGFLFFLTAGQVGKSAELFETYLSESVTGLESGAPVRYRGVRIGQVTEIGLVNAEYRPDSRSQAAAAFQLVLVRMALDPKRATMPNVEAAQRAVQNGLRARLSSQGLTGVSYVELDFVDPERFPPREVPWAPAYPVIPSIPSTVAQVQDAAEQVLSRIQNAPIEEILSNIAGLTGALNGQVHDGDLARTLREAAETMATLRQAVADADIAGTMRDVRGVASNLNDLTGGPEAKRALASIAAAADGLRTAASQLPAAIQSLERTARSARGVTQDTNADLAPILRDLRAVASNLRDTTELLRRFPGAAILGAPPPPPR